jgi:hypothetical protein
MNHCQKLKRVKKQQGAEKLPVIQRMERGLLVEMQVSNGKFEKKYFSVNTSKRYFLAADKKKIIKAYDHKINIRLNSIQHWVRAFRRFKKTEVDQ